MCRKRNKKYETLLPDALLVHRLIRGAIFSIKTRGLNGIFKRCSSDLRHPVSQTRTKSIKISPWSSFPNRERRFPLNFFGIDVTLSIYNRCEFAPSRFFFRACYVHSIATSGFMCSSVLKYLSSSLRLPPCANLQVFPKLPRPIFFVIERVKLSEISDKRRANFLYSSAGIQNLWGGSRRGK